MSNLIKTIQDILLTREDRGPPKDNVFYCSQLGTGMRKLYYDRKYPEPMDLKMAGILLIGTLIHDYLEEKLKEKDLYIASERRISKRYGSILFVGYFDLLLLYPHGLHCLDIKSTGFNAWGFLGDAPKDYYIPQINTYLDILGITYGSFLHVKKEDFELKEIPWTYSKDIMSKTVEKFLILYHHLKTSKVPPVDCEPWMCQYCSHVDRCKINSS